MDRMQGTRRLRTRYSQPLWYPVISAGSHSTGAAWPIASAADIRKLSAKASFYGASGKAERQRQPSRATGRGKKSVTTGFIETLTFDASTHSFTT